MYSTVYTIRYLKHFIQGKCFQFKRFHITLCSQKCFWSYFQEPCHDKKDDDSWRKSCRAKWLIHSEFTAQHFTFRYQEILKIVRIWQHVVKFTDITQLNISQKFFWIKSYCQSKTLLGGFNLQFIWIGKDSCPCVIYVQRNGEKTDETAT